MQSEAFGTEAAAVEDLRDLQVNLFPSWLQAEQRASHLEALLRARSTRQRLADLASRPLLSFASRRLREIEVSASRVQTGFTQQSFRGFHNLGNTCYLNAVTQCLFHCAPFQEDLERQVAGSSVLGDALRNLFAVYKVAGISEVEVRPHLAAWVEKLLAHTSFVGGAQEDAAKCLMHILMAVDQGHMQRRVCGANAVSSVENMLLCPADESAQVSRAAGVVDMAALLMTTWTGDQAIAEAADALVVRLDNVYEVDGAYFSVDAEADWSRTNFGITVRNAPQAVPEYSVAGYVAHIGGDQVDGLQRMRGGHYVAYVRSGDTWFELDDQHVRLLPSPPKRFPYLLFLTRMERVDARRRVRGKRPGTFCSFAAEQLLRDRAASTAGAAAHLGSPRDGGNSGASQLAGRHRNRSGRDQSGRAQPGRDQSGRDQSGQDHSGRQQARPSRMQDNVPWRGQSSGDNSDHSRSDAVNDMDNPFCALS